MSDGLQATLGALNQLVSQIKAYIAEMPAGDRFLAPIIDWHHPTDYDQTTVQGLNKFLHHVQKEQAIIEALAESSSQPTEYTSNLISLEGVWAAFLKAPKPVTAIWQAIDKVPGFKNGNGSMKIDVVGDGGSEWIKVNTIKESRLLAEFREQDSYLNSDYESDSSSAAPELSNSLLNNARILARAAAEYPRMPGLGPPRLRYVLTRLEATGHADARVAATLAEMRRLGIRLEFADAWAAPPPRQTPEVRPGADVVLDLSILIALCCDSTHHPLPADAWALESRFRTLRVAENADGAGGARLVLGDYTNATRDLRDQLRCEVRRPLVAELIARLGGRPVRFWVTREVSGRLPRLVDVIGGDQEQYRARALFGPEDFWAGSRWQARVGPNLADLRVGVIDDEPSISGLHISEAETNGAGTPAAGPRARRAPPTPFDAAVVHVCADMLRVSPDSGSATPASADAEPKEPQGKKSKNPARARAGTRFSNAKLPSGHTLRTLLAGVERGMTVLTNNRGAVLKVLREEGVNEGIPFAFPAGPAADGVGGAVAEEGGEGGEGGEGEETTRARIWIVNPSSLAEWRRLQVERANAELLAQTGGRIDRTIV